MQRCIAVFQIYWYLKAHKVNVCKMQNSGLFLHVHTLRLIKRPHLRQLYSPLYTCCFFHSSVNVTIVDSLDSHIMSLKVQLESEYDHQSNHIIIPFSPAKRGLTFLNMGCYTACCSEVRVKGIP